MTREGMSAAMAMLSAAYQAPVTEAMLLVYQTAFEGVESAELSAAALEWIKTGKRFPRPAELREIVQHVRDRNRETIEQEHRRLKLADWPTSVDEFGMAAVGLCKRIMRQGARATLEAELENPTLPNDQDWCRMIVQEISALPPGL